MPGGRKRRIVGVCTTCRQDKLKCDSETTHPHPCTRCKERGLHCTIDPAFKRTPARQKFKSMADELAQLKQARGMSELADQHDRLSRSPPAAWNQMSRSPPATWVQQSGPSTTSSPNYSMMSPSAPTCSFVLGFQTFTPTEVDIRFNIYVTHFHPRLPLLDLETKKESMYQYSPLLFWTVMAITCRFEPLVNHDQQLFLDDYLALLSATNHAPPLSLQTIQALVLVCNWPMLVTKRHLNDISWLHYSIAVGAASYLKLGSAHKMEMSPGTRFSPSDIANMSKTWLGLFCIANQYSSWCGIDMTPRQPAVLAAIDEILDSQPVQTELTARAAISKVAAKHISQITDSLNLLTHETLIEYSSADLDDVPRKYAAIWTHHLEILVHATKLSFITPLLISFGKMRQQHGVETSNIDARTARNVLVGSRLASQIIANFEVVLEAGSSPGDTLTPVHKYSMLPKAYFHIIMFASFFLLRFCVSNTLCRESDRLASYKAVERARDALRRCCRDPNIPDEPLGVSSTLAMLLQYQQSGGPNEFLIDDRGSGSIIWDTVRQIKALKGGNANSWNSRADLFQLINPERSAELGGEHQAIEDMYGFDQVDIGSLMQGFSQIGSFDDFHAGYVDPSLASHSPELVLRSQYGPGFS